MQRACIGHVDVQSGGGRAQGAQGLKQLLRFGNLVQQTADQNGIESLAAKGGTASRVFQKVLDHEDAIVRAGQVAGMFRKMSARLHDGQFRELPIIREDGGHAATHFQYASGLPEFQLGGHHPLAQCSLGWLEGGGLVASFVACQVAGGAGRGRGGNVHACCHRSVEVVCFTREAPDGWHPWCAGTGAPGRASVPVAVWDSADGKAVMPGSDSDAFGHHTGRWRTGQGDGNARCLALGEGYLAMRSSVSRKTCREKWVS